MAENPIRIEPKARRNRKAHDGHNRLPSRPVLVMAPPPHPRASKTEIKTYPNPPRSRGKLRHDTYGAQDQSNTGEINKRKHRAWVGIGGASGISYLARRGVAGRAPALAQATGTGWVGLRCVGLGLGIGDRLPGLYISLPRRVLSPRLLRDGTGGRGRVEWRGRGLITSGALS